MKSTNPQNSDLGLPFRHVLHHYQSNFLNFCKIITSSGLARIRQAHEQANATVKGDDWMMML
jgi:hypothetical protein